MLMKSTGEELTCLVNDWKKNPDYSSFTTIPSLIILNNWNVSQSWAKTASKMTNCHEHTGNKTKNICKRQSIQTLPGSQAVHWACLRSECEGEPDIVHGGTSGYTSKASARKNTWSTEVMQKCWGQSLPFFYFHLRDSFIPGSSITSGFIWKFPSWITSTSLLWRLLEPGDFIKKNP